jgi:capsular exopolysaccharide synthesis family protein
VLEGSRGYDGTNQIKAYQQTQEVLLRSTPVLSAALKNPDAANLSTISKMPPDEAIQWLAEKLQVKFTGDVMTVAMTGDDPQEIVALVKSVTSAYLDEVVEKEKQTRRARHDALRDSLDKSRESLKEKRKLLTEQTGKSGTDDPNAISLNLQLKMEEMGLLRRELSLVSAEKRDVEMDLALLPKPRTVAPAAPAPEGQARLPQPDLAELKAAVENHPSTAAYQERVSELTQTWNRFRGVSRSGSDPAIRQVEKQLADARKALASHQARLRDDLLRQYQQAALGQSSPIAGGPAPAAGESLAYLEQKRDLLKDQEDRLKAQLTEKEESLKALGSVSLDLQSTRDDIEYIRRTTDQLGLTAERVNIELQAPDRITAVEKAETAQPLSNRRRVMASGMAGLGTLSLILCGFAWLDARTRRVDRVDDVVQGLGMNLVGVLPALPGRSQRKLNRGGDWEHLLMESVDATRTMLLHASRTEKLRVLMVTSALKAEGKTSLACHLSTSLARARQRTLLIDCDLRSPAIHALFDLPGGPGVCEILRGEIGVADAVQATAAPGLSLITAGRCDAAALSALAHGRLQEVLLPLRDQYDFVIVDSAPVLPVADSLQIAQHADAVVFSVLRDVSRLPRIHEAYERLANLGVRMLGAVVAGTRQSHGYYAYGNYGNASATSEAGATVSV